MVIKIQFQPFKDAGFTKEQMVRFSNEAAKEHGKAFAMDIIADLSKWLGFNPGLEVDHPIAETGETARSFEIKEGVAKSINHIEIVEGGNSKYIRKGLPPGTNVSLPRIKMWAARKNIKLLSSAEYASQNKENSALTDLHYGRAIIIEAFGSRSKKGKPFTTSTHAKASRDQKKVVNAALSAIRRVIRESGTNRAGANWYSYYPKNKGMFDYPTYLAVARRTHMFNLATAHAHGTADAMMSYWNSSGKHRVYDPTISRAEGGSRSPRRIGAIH